MKRGLTVVASLFALCILTASVIVVAPPALAASTSTSSALETWYQQSGRPAFERFTADAQRFRAVNASTTTRAARQDCNRFKLDVLSASHGKLPPQPTLAFDYRYYLLAAARSFTECMTGIEQTNDVQVAEGTQGGALAVQAAVKIIKGAEGGKVVAVPPSSTDLQPSIPASLLVPQCYADFKILEVAVEAYERAQPRLPRPAGTMGCLNLQQRLRPSPGLEDGWPMDESAPRDDALRHRVRLGGKCLGRTPGTVRHQLQPGSRVVHGVRCRREVAPVRLHYRTGATCPGHGASGSSTPVVCWVGAGGAGRRDSG